MDPIWTWERHNILKLQTVKIRILERQNQENRSDDNERTAIKRYQTYEKSNNQRYHLNSHLIQGYNTIFYETVFDNGKVLPSQ